MTSNQPYMDKDTAICFLMNNSNEFIIDVETNVVWCFEMYRTSSSSDNSINIISYINFPNSRFLRIYK